MENVSSCSHRIGAPVAWLLLAMCLFHCSSSGVQAVEKRCRTAPPADLCSLAPRQSVYSVATSGRSSSCEAANSGHALDPSASFFSTSVAAFDPSCTNVSLSCLRAVIAVRCAFSCMRCKDDETFLRPCSYVCGYLASSCSEYSHCFPSFPFLSASACASEEETIEGLCTEYSANVHNIFDGAYTADGRQHLLPPVSMTVRRGFAEGAWEDLVLSSHPGNIMYINFTAGHAKQLALLPNEQLEHVSEYTFHLPSWFDEEALESAQVLISIIGKDRGTQLWKVKARIYSEEGTGSFRTLGINSNSWSWKANLWLLTLPMMENGRLPYVSYSNNGTARRRVRIQISTPINSQPGARSEDNAYLDYMRLRLLWKPRQWKEVRTDSWMDSYLLPVDDIVSYL